MVAIRFLSLLAVSSLLSCAGAPRFPLQAPLERDHDQRLIAEEPEEYFSPFAWDGANQMIFRPVSRFFAVDPAGPAVNVNALDEVPDSSWFENRLGVRRMTPAEVERGSCDEKALDPSAPDGAWVIDKGKDDGANPGFRIKVEGLGKFMLKSDPPGEPDRATGATAIATRIYHAVGYYAPCDTVVYLRPELLKLTPGLTITNNQGETSPLDEARLSSMLTGASRRDGKIRMVASSWLPGKPLGPYRYEGVRSDDPNDVVPHEDRRELRGGRLLAAWLNHFDSREQNTMDVFMRPEGKKDGPGYIRHYIMDLGDCFGSVWSVDGISRRLGSAYVLDVPYVTEDFLTLGAIRRPWERVRRLGGVFNYFSARDFDPEYWRGEYPNPAFSRMTEADGAWMARILARFTDDLVAAAVRVGKYDPASERYLTQTLIERRDAILRRYLGRLSPISDVHVTPFGVCGIDRARQAGVVPNEGVSFRARVYRGGDLEPSKSLGLITSGTPKVCVDLKHLEYGPDVAPDDPDRYVVVDIENGYARGPLRAHLYDLGVSGGFRLVGVERPQDGKRP